MIDTPGQRLAVADKGSRVVRVVELLLSNLCRGQHDDDDEDEDEDDSVDDDIQSSRIQIDREEGHTICHFAIMINI